MRLLDLLLVLVVLIGCGPANVERKKDGQFEIRGKILKRIAHCGERPTPVPFPNGEIAIVAGGKTVAQPKADAKGAYKVTLPPGSYCVRAIGDSDCYARWELPEQGMPAKTPDNEVVVTEFDMKGCN